MKRKQMGKVKRGESVNSAAKVGRNDARKMKFVCSRIVCSHICSRGLVIDDARRDMIAGSIRRKEKDRKIGGQTVGHDTDVLNESAPAE